MSDFNTMFDEQVAVQESAGSTQRILEAMLKRDALEIQYRQQGISEAQIAEFHEAATKAIQEGFGDMVASAKGAMSRGWAATKDAAGRAKNAGSKAWGYAKEKGAALWEKIKELFAKFVAFCKKIWVTIRNYFADDAKFYNKYKNELDNKDNQSRYADLEYNEVKDFDEKPADNLSVEKYNDFVEKCYSYRIETSKAGSGHAGVVAAGEVLTSKKNTDALDDLIKAAERELRDNSSKDEDEAKRLGAYLKALRASQNTIIRVTKARHKAAKSFIIRCISKCKGVKSTTESFMVEAACTEIDKAYAFAEADEYKSVSGAWKSGDGAWEKIKGAGAAIWNNIVTFFKKMWSWITGKFAAAWEWIKKQWNKLKVWWNGEGKKNNPDAQVNAPVIDKAKMDNVLKALDNGEVITTENVIDKRMVRIDELLNQLSIHDTTIEAVRKRLDTFNAQLKKYSNSHTLNRRDDTILAEKKKWEKRVAAAKELLKLLEGIERADMAAIKEANAIAAKKDKEHNDTYDQYGGNGGRVDENAGFDALMNDVIIEAYQIIVEADEVDPLLDTAAGNDPMHVGDVNLAGTEVLPQGASTDPNALDYDKTNCFSQTVEIGDEGIAGKVGAELGDTETQVKAGNETPSVNQEAAELAREFAELDAMLA